MSEKKQAVVHQTCAGCRYFFEDQDEPGDGFCFLNPPTLLADPEGVSSMRPFVHAEDPACSHIKQRLNS